MAKLAPKKKRKPPASPSLRLEWRSPAELAENPANWRRHPDAQLSALSDVIAEVGWAGACLFNERTKRLIDGHARKKIAKPGELIPVLVGSWSEEDERKILATLDPLAAMAEADAGALAKLLADVSTQSEAVNAMLAELAEASPVLPEPGGGGDEFDATPDAGPTRTAGGETWIIGGVHRLYVGDCTGKGNVERLFAGERAQAVLTDPPYGVNEQCDRGARRRGLPFGGVGKPGPWAKANDFPNVAGDDKPFDPAGVLALGDGANIILFGANYFAERLPPSPSWIVWDKLNGLTTDKREVGFNDNADAELAWSNLGGPARIFSHRWMGLSKGSEHGDARVHPTQKPVALMEWCIKRASEEGGLILDPFLGSGTTLIAAHRLGRRCYGCEIEPRYADVILKRAEAEGLGVEKAT